MNRLRRRLTRRSLAMPLGLAALMLLVGAPLSADETGASARAIADKHGAAVVPVQVVVKMRVAYEGEEVDEDESSNELTATIIDPSGLAVCALSEVDPTHMIELWQEEDPDYKIDAQVTDLKFILPEGKEIPAKVILRDRDLDLAFIRPPALSQHLKLVLALFTHQNVDRATARQQLLHQKTPNKSGSTCEEVIHRFSTLPVACSLSIHAGPIYD